MVDEDRFRTLHAEVNEHPCIFSRALLRRCADCTRAQRLLLAEREAVACRSPAARTRCAALYQRLRESALFALQLNRADPETPLPHEKELKLQCGGLLGLSALLSSEPAPAQVTDVAGLLERLQERYTTSADLPLETVVKSVAGYRGRSKHRHRR